MKKLQKPGTEWMMPSKYSSTPLVKPKILMKITPKVRKLEIIAEKTELNPYQDGSFIMAPSVLNMLSA